MQNLIIIFIHITASGIAVGSMVYCVLLFLPALEKQKDISDAQPITHKALDILAPTVFVSILVLIGTGIYFLMANYTAQVELTQGYYNLLGVKMIFVVTAFFISVYQTFTLRGQIANLDLDPEKRKLVPSTLHRMRTLSGYILAALSAAIFLGLWLASFKT